MRIVLLVLVLLLRTGPAHQLNAHEVRPAYLELRQTAADRYDVLWKVPGQGEDLRLAIYVRLPEQCQRVGEIRRAMIKAAYTERWTVQCAGGLTGSAIRIVGLSATVIEVLARLERLDGTTQVIRLTPTASNFVVQAAASQLEVAGTYLRLGVEHILGGIDHLLFVLALLILVTGTRRLIATVTAFTVAHSLTLAGATLGLVRVPQRPIEAVIALSIVFVAAEIVHGREGRPGLTARWPWIVAFTFGLLHGFGFAGALSEVGLPQQAIPVALLFFNLGVESGQLLFIAAILVAGWVVRRLPPRLAPSSTWAWRVPPYAIGGMASYWVIQRIAQL